MRRQSRRWLKLGLCLEYQLFDDACRALRPIQTQGSPFLEYLKFTAFGQILERRIFDVFQDAPQLHSVNRLVILAYFGAER